MNNRFRGRNQQRLVAWFEDWMPSFATGIIAGTRYILDRFADLGFPRERMTLVPNGVDETRFALLQELDLDDRLRQLHQELGLLPEHRVVVYVGSMSLVSHAVDLLLQALALVVQREPQARLVLVGSGEDLPGLQALATDLDIQDQTLFVGRVASELVPLYFRLGEMTVDPLQDTIPARSSLSLKLVESLVAGVPCVTTNIGDRREIVGEAGIAVTAGNAAALAEAILTILHDPARQTTMRQEAETLRPRLLWRSRVQEVIKLYQQTLGEKL